MNTGGPGATEGGADWLRGSLPVIPTPLTVDQHVDHDSLRRLLERVAEVGGHAVVVLGSGGEGAYLTGDERADVVTTATAAADGGLKVVAGVMRYGTRQAVDDARRLADSGADGLLVTLPQYYRTPLDTIFVHYDAVVGPVDVPVLYYHYPGVTGLRPSPADIGRLFSRVPLAGTKETGLSTRELKAHIDAIKRPVRVFTGQSFDLLDSLDGGAAGAISPVSLLMPRTERELVHAQRRDDRATAERAQRRLFDALPIISPIPVPVPLARPAMRAILRFGLPVPVGVGVPHAGVKEALVARGLIANANVRDPQPALTAAQRRRVRVAARHVLEL